MLRNRLFNVLIAAALVLVMALTVREAFATTAVTSQPDTVPACAALPSPLSIHSRYMEEARTFVVYTNNGPAGVDGGLLELMSAYARCSR